VSEARSTDPGHSRALRCCCQNCDKGYFVLFHSLLEHPSTDNKTLGRSMGKCGDHRFQSKLTYGYGVPLSLKSVLNMYDHDDDDSFNESAISNHQTTCLSCLCILIFWKSKSERNLNCSLRRKYLSKWWQKQCCRSTCYE
jgi:hypothetical protein